MRDGVKLATDLYLPQTDSKVPVILIRTPYKKEMVEIQGRYYARRGYVVAIQDCRGRFGSGGVWEPFLNEAKDGYDAIEWLAAQPWSNGKVGMIGGSYVGWVQWWAASERPAAPGHDHPERVAAGPVLQSPLRARRVLHLRRHLVGGHSGIQGHRRFIGRSSRAKSAIRSTGSCCAGCR